MSRAAIYEGDIDFLIKQIEGLTDSLHHELPSEFVERVRYLTSDLTPFPGKFSFNKFPYFRKIVDCFNPLDPTREVVLMKGNQMGATTAVLETVLLYHIMSDPKAQMYVTADAGLMRTSVQIRIEKMIDDAGARDLIFSQSRKRKGSRNSGDTSIAKEYPGGYLHFFGGKSPARFRGIAYPIALADEVDAFPDKIPKEGTVTELVRNRTDSYSAKRKILWTSTPLLKQSSKIEALFELGDQEKFFVPCKHCGTMQELVWHGKTDNGYEYGIVWENDEHFMPIIGDEENGIQTTVAYKCCNPDCGGLMKNYDKATIIPRGEWRPTATPKQPYIKSFHITPIYNPPGMYSWDDMVKQWAQCWDIEYNRLKDKEKYRVFRNTKQGKTFEDFGTQIKYERVIQFRRTGFIKGHVPNDLAVKDSGSPVLIIIASVDVQKKNLFVDVKGYSNGGVTWTIDFFPIEGDTEQFNGPWDELDKYISDTRFIGTDGKIYWIRMTIVDSGHYTEYVYEFVKRHSFGVYACKGQKWINNGETYTLFSAKALQQIGMAQAFHINTGKLKDKISVLLTRSFWVGDQRQPWWYPNFPEDFRDDYFQMFEAEVKEEVIDKKTNKVTGTLWRQLFGKDNHAFDTYVYNLAALEIAAEYYCRDRLGLPALDYTTFWEMAKAGEFYEEPIKK
ncbi:MAG: phage terminase large subunit family protein [Spirochaetaceae bacterium]|jgi:phage terminase large subunit GpA-like protein|nr:phage terminase large subunit family protein [Spirochaetaceae bacterium]